MSLTKLLADNPAAKIEYDAAIAAARTEGETAEKARIAATAPILESDKYPSAIKRVAIDALKGAVSSEALTIAVAVYDATQEQTAQAVAQAASAAADETRQEQEAAKLDPSKPISSQAELDALIAAQKKGA